MLILTCAPAEAQPPQEFLIHVKRIAFLTQTIYHLQKHLLGSEAEDILYAADSVMDFLEDDEETGDAAEEKV